MNLNDSKDKQSDYLKRKTNQYRTWESICIGLDRTNPKDIQLLQDSVNNGVFWVFFIDDDSSKTLVLSQFNSYIKQDFLDVRKYSLNASNLSDPFLETHLKKIQLPAVMVGCGKNLKIIPMESTRRDILRLCSSTIKYFHDYCRVIFIQSTLVDFLKHFEIKLLPRHVKELRQFVNNYDYITSQGYDSPNEKELLSWHLFYYVTRRCRQEISDQSFRQYLVERGFPKIEENDLWGPRDFSIRAVLDLDRSFEKVPLGNKIPVTLTHFYKRYRQGFWFFPILSILGDWLLLARDWKLVIKEIIRKIKGRRIKLL